MSDQDIKFNYDIKITAGADFLRKGPLSKTLPGSNEVIITSKDYKEYDDCEKSLQSLLHALSYLEAKFSSKGHVIYTRVNPLVVENNDNKNDVEIWDKFTIMRSYIVDAEALKASALDYNMFGQIRINQPIEKLIT